MRSVSYQRNVGDYLFPEFLVLFTINIFGDRGLKSISDHGVDDKPSLCSPSSDAVCTQIINPCYTNPNIFDGRIEYNWRTALSEGSVVILPRSVVQIHFLNEKS
jgi:hypothetical protein